MIHIDFNMNKIGKAMHTNESPMFESSATLIHESSCHLIHKLPLELRNEIYKLSLPAPEYTPYFRRKALHRESQSYFATPALARTCRQIRAEALAVFLGNNILRVELADTISLDAVFFQRWLESLGEDVKLIRHLEIQHQLDLSTRTWSTWSPYTSPIIARVWAATRFKAGAEGDVSVECNFNSEENLGDEIRAGSLCDCPLRSRFADGPSTVLGKMHRCGLTEAISRFIKLMDIEAVESCLTQPPYSTRVNEGDIWPKCDYCNAPKWFLQGPRSTDGHRRLALSGVKIR
ncbi:hypothetical protein B0O99DRAFT_343405 [Bisporella sp. PMI_857]|nr:hypothetical protein B0O99DRAFT_343405 [Bisporella sp. PMI_857]